MLDFVGYGLQPVHEPCILSGALAPERGFSWHLHFHHRLRIQDQRFCPVYGIETEGGKKLEELAEERRVLTWRVRKEQGAGGMAINGCRKLCGLPVRLRQTNGNRESAGLKAGDSLLIFIRPSPRHAGAGETKGTTFLEII
jgi:hypothetical protein